MSGENWDVFIFYAHADVSWVETLAENLHQLGLAMFNDDWEIDAGDVRVHKIESAFLASTNGVLVVTPRGFVSAMGGEEYASMTRQAIEKGFRLIPVLWADADMPAFLANRAWIVFRYVYDPECEKKVRSSFRETEG